MNVSLISVIVPAYNAAQWIEECCDSVWNQTYPNVELIVVDDGSGDTTLSILENLALNRKNMQVIHTENGGVCRARNTGLNAARGEYIAFLDADDLLMPDALSFLYNCLQESNSDIAIGQKLSVKKNGTEVEQHYPKSREQWQGTEALENSLRDHPATYSVWGKLYRREVVEDVRFAEGRRVHEDSFFLFQCLLKQPRVTVHDRQVLRYRVTDNSASRAVFSDKYFDILYFAEEKKRIISEKYPQFLELAENVIVKANMALLQLLCQTWDKKYRKAEKTCLQTIMESSTYFIPATTWDQTWFRIITGNKYILYKVKNTCKNIIKAILKRIGRR